METKEITVEGKRWSGAEWASEKQEVMIVGAGGIGSWLALCLSRIEHNIWILDGDLVDSTNVEGGQMYRMEDVGTYKVHAVANVCRQMGCYSRIDTYEENYTEDTGIMPIVIIAVDNMKTRKQAFEDWTEVARQYTEEGNDVSGFLFIDGRLLLENMEILCVQGNNEEQIKKYREEYLFSDEDVPDLECTVKQSTFGAMTIAGLITATLCNWLTNNKLGTGMRTVPFYQRMFFPIFDNKQINIYAKETV